jgi:hypothetical protein
MTKGWLFSGLRSPGSERGLICGSRLWKLVPKTLSFNTEPMQRSASFDYVNKCWETREDEGISGHRNSE